MKFRLLAVLLPIINSQVALSQTDTAHAARNVLFMEAGGVGGYGSINYERIVYIKNKFMLATRCGLSTYHIRDYTNEINPDILIPLLFNGTYGRNHCIELGIGVTFSNIAHPNKTDLSLKRQTNLHSVSSIGYRYQKKSGGVIFRCDYTPLYEFNGYLRHWAGLSLGYSF